MSGTDLAELSIALLDGAFEEPLWSTFLDRLRAATKADFAVLIVQPPGRRKDEVLQVISGEASVEQSRAIYRKYFYPSEPVSRHVAPDGEPLSLDDLQRLDRGVHADFYRKLIDGLGIIDLREMRVQEPSGVDAWLGIARRSERFTREEHDILKKIAPVLRRVMRIYVARERDRFAASLSAEAVRRLRCGWLALDRKANVLDADEFGEHLLASAGVIGCNAGRRLTISPTEIEREVHNIVSKMADDPECRPHAICLRQDPWLDMLLVPATNSHLPTSTVPAAIAYLHRDNWTSTDRCGQLTDLFALSPTQARLTLSICRGRSVAEAADEVGITIETARSYLKEIYERTGARRLPDLVRIIMGSILAIAP